MNDFINHDSMWDFNTEHDLPKLETFFPLTKEMKKKNDYFWKMYYKKDKTQKNLDVPFRGKEKEKKAVFVVIWTLNDRDMNFKNRGILIFLTKKFLVGFYNHRKLSFITMLDFWCAE